MKKAVSLVLITAILLSSTPMHAGHKRARAWAYTKVVLGWGTGIMGILSSLNAIGTLKEIDTREKISSEWLNYLLTLIKNNEGKTIDLSDANVHAQTAVGHLKNINYNPFEVGKAKGTIGGNSLNILTMLPLGILLVKSGKRDLRRIRKQELKEKKYHKTRC